jgi:type IV pilus assembly protein PilM
MFKLFNFGLGKKRSLGIDVGTSSIKIVELEFRNEKPFLSNYAWMSVPESPEKNSQEASFEELTPEYIKSLISKAGLSKDNTYMSIPAFGGLITLIDFPDMPEEDMEQAIRFEAHKYIPTSLDDVTISWEVVGEDKISVSEGEKKEFERKKQVLLVAASKSRILSYENMAKEAGFTLKGVEMESISMVESLVGNDKGNFIIVDIGCQMCNVIGVEKGVIKANRNIDAGGNDITRTIATNLGITAKRAEAMKKSGDNFFTTQSSLSFTTLDLILAEVSRVSDVLSRVGNAPGVNALILSGGSANLVGLKEFFQSRTKMKTIIGDPFGRVEYDNRLKPALDKFKGRFSVSVGLALKGMKEFEKNK